MVGLFVVSPVIIMRVNQHKKVGCLSYIRLKSKRSLSYAAFRRDHGFPDWRTMQARILIYGNDPILLMTRRLILEKARFRVFTTLKLADAMQLLVTQKLDVLILCQTLGDEERESAIVTAQALFPSTKTLVMTCDKWIFDMETEVLDPLARPEMLLAVIDRMTTDKHVLI
jgi:hypothetical protein